MVILRFLFGHKGIRMGLLELILVAVALSMDAFAVSICKGLSMRKVDLRYAIVLAIFFGGFQALMPTIGWLLGSRFSKYITAVDHWIAFGLLVFLGVKMIVDVIREGDEEKVEAQDRIPLDLKEMFVLAVATSIDALAVGITFAFLEVRLAPSVSLIGCITFGFTVGGVFIGNIFGSKWKNAATIAGGVILICIGLKILLEHLGILP